jgi:uncharacterized protein (DUF58 family)
VLYQLVDVMVATVVICGVWSLLSVRGLALERVLREDRAQVGGVLEQTLQVRGRFPFPRIWVELQDGGTLPDYRTGRVLDLGFAGGQTMSLRAACRRRGYYNLGPARLAGADPLGLFRSSRHIGKAHPVLVYPRTVDLVGLALPAGRMSGGERRRNNWMRTSAHISGIREYRPGDPVRHVHWRSTAHAGRLMVKEFDAEPIGDVWVFLDLEAAVQRGEGDESTEEYGVTIAASLVKHFLQHGRAVGLVAVGGERRLLPLERGQRQLTKALEELAMVRANGCTTLADVLAGDSGRVNPSQAVFVVTPSSDGGWPAALHQLRGRGVRAAAIVLDAASFDASPGSPSSAGTGPDAWEPSWRVKRGDAIGEALAAPARWVGAGA